MRRNRFAVANQNTIDRFRFERNKAMADARHLYDHHGDARRVVALVAEARAVNRKLLWALRTVPGGV